MDKMRLGLIDFALPHELSRVDTKVEPKSPPPRNRFEVDSALPNQEAEPIAPRCGRMLLRLE